MLRRGTGVTVLLLLTALGWAASAAASCNPGRVGGQVVDYESGWRKTPSAGTCFSGSLAYISVYHPYTEYGSSSAAVELYDAGTGSYGAVGWEQNQTLGFVGFDEVNVVNGHFFTDTWGGPTGDPSFKITFSGGYFHTFENDSNYYNYSEPAYEGCSIKQDGFVNDATNQMPGAIEVPVQFTHSEIQHSSDGEWYYTDASTYIIGPGGWYATDKISSTEDEIWDQACYY